jgi:hypothetical protein
MVIAKILRLLQLHRPQLRIRSILAMHIDYGNRPESAQEAAYVRRWCEGDAVQQAEGTSTGASDGAGAGAATSSAMLGGLQCRVRRVDEVTRGVTSRDEYEKVSRDIRYGFYRTCIEEVAQQLGEGEGLVSGVIFGHHLGDVQENVISNVMRCVQCQLKPLPHWLLPTFPTLQRVRAAAAVGYDRLLRYQRCGCVAAAAGSLQGCDIRLRSQVCQDGTHCTPLDSAHIAMVLQIWRALLQGQHALLEHQRQAAQPAAAPAAGHVRVGLPAEPHAAGQGE